MATEQDHVCGDPNGLCDAECMDKAHMSETDRANYYQHQMRTWRDSALDIATERDALRSENEWLKTGDIGEAYNCGEQKVMDLLGAANVREKQLRAELERLRGDNAQLQATITKMDEEERRNNDELMKLIRLRLGTRNVHGAFDGVEQLTARAEAAEGREREAQAHCERLKQALEDVLFECDGHADCDDGDDGIANIPNMAMRCEMIAQAALAETPAQSLARVKAEAVRAAAGRCYDALNARGKHAGARRDGWEDGIVDFAKYMECESDLIESEGA